MFDRIGRRYDLMNTVMTGGRDAAWRRLAVWAAGARPGQRALDLATGTGEFALELQRAGCRTVGLDFSLGMLAEAWAKNETLGPAQRPLYVAGDALRAPFADASFDLVTTGFMLRNVTSIPQALAEMRRLLRPGGTLACLELTPLKGRYFPRLFDLYFDRLVPLLGRLLADDGAAYSYLPGSVKVFLDAEQLAEQLRAAGFQQVQYRRLALDTVALHLAR